MQNDNYERQLKAQVYNRNQLESQLEQLEHKYAKATAELKSKEFEIKKSVKNIEKSEKRAEKLKEIIEQLGKTNEVSSAAIEKHAMQLEALTSEKEVLESIVESHQQNYQDAMLQIKAKERRIHHLEEVKTLPVGFIQFRQFWNFMFNYIFRTWEIFKHE